MAFHPSTALRRIVAGAVLAAALVVALGAAGCASKPKPTPTPRPEDIGKVSPDKALARMLASGNLELARKTAETLAASKEPGEREAGVYWKALCLLYANQVDSALAIFEGRAGKWSGGLRTVHSEAFLRLARELSQAQAAMRSRKDELSNQESKLEGLQKETGDLRAENARLATEKQKYEKLLKDLETIR
jgi:hypothetical protein